MIQYSKEFVELAQRLNYAKAAEALHLSPSTLSRHISELESVLGFALFNRAPLSLTNAGQYYLASISSVIEEIDGIVAKGREIESRSEGFFSVYMLPCRTPFADVVYEALATMRNHAPGLITSVCVDGRFLTTEEAILQGKADVGVLYDVSKAIPETIECIPFVDAPITAWVREENPLAKRDTVFFEDLASFVHPLSTNMQSRTATDAVIRLFSQRGITMRSRIRNLESRADFYLTMLDDEFVISFQADTDPQRINPGLKRIVFAEPVIYHVHLAVLRDGGNPLVDQFIRICCDAAQKRNLLAD